MATHQACLARKGVALKANHERGEPGFSTPLAPVLKTGTRYTGMQSHSTAEAHAQVRAQRATLEAFQWRHGISPDASGTIAEAYSTLNQGGSDELFPSNATISCHGTLQSAGNASWPLYRRTRQC